MSQIRNVAIIAHVDHGKTTLVDEILKQAQVFRENEETETCVLDSNDQERERGITILSKIISVNYGGCKLNIIDTPGHADFGGQVERVLKKADCVLLLVDAAEGPMPQTRFVLNKAIQLNLQPIVVINKVDKDDARCDEVLDEVHDLFFELGASEEQVFCPVFYGSGRDGWFADSPEGSQEDIKPLLNCIVNDIKPPAQIEGPVQLQITTIDYSSYVGRIGIGRVYRGTLDKNKPVMTIADDGTQVRANIKQLFVFDGLGRREVESVECGDICAIVGLTNCDIGLTVCDAEEPEVLPKLELDKPTLSMLFRVNDSPLFGQEGELVTSRQVADRLFKEVEKDVALEVEDVNGEAFRVSGRGILHLSILIESMRREGYELSVSQPQVITRDIDGVKHEPIENLSVEVPEESGGKVIEIVGGRRGEMKSMETRSGRTMLNFSIPTRGIIGLRSRLLTATQGEAIIGHSFEAYEPMKGDFPHRRNGVLISMAQGESTAFAIDALQQRGIFFIDPNIDVYEGMVVGENSREGDLMVNVLKNKQLTNVRSSGTDKAIKITPASVKSLEEYLEYVGADELVECTPKNIRLRKRLLKEVERKRGSKLS